MQETWVQSLGWEDPLEKGRLPTPEFWPGEAHGLYSPWGHRESDTTERLHFHSSLSCIGGGNGNPLQCSCLENSMDYTVHGILQARILEWVAFPSPGDLPNPGIEPRSPANAGYLGVAGSVPGLGTPFGPEQGCCHPDSSLPSHQQTLQKNPLPGLQSIPCPGSSHKIPRLSCCNISLTTSLAYPSRIFSNRAQAPSSLAYPVGDRPQFQGPGLKAPGCCTPQRSVAPDQRDQSPTPPPHADPQSELGYLATWFPTCTKTGGGPDLACGSLLADPWSGREVPQHAITVSTLIVLKGDSPPGSSVHGISQARTLEGVAFSFSRGSS